MTKADKKHLFWASMPFMNYVFSKGKLAVFRHYRYATDVQSEIDELMHEIKHGHPNISIKEDQLYLTDEMEDPMLALRKKIIADYLAEQAKHVDPENDMGISVQEQIKPMNTSDVAAVAAGGDATQSAAKLVALTQSMAAKAGK